MALLSDVFSENNFQEYGYLHHQVNSTCSVLKNSERWFDKDSRASVLEPLQNATTENLRSEMMTCCCLQNGQMSTGGSSSSSNPQLELSFEYLMSRDKLQWITIASEQAILMSVCLQAMVDELLLKKTGMKRKQVCSCVRFSVLLIIW